MAMGLVRKAWIKMHYFISPTQSVTGQTCGRKERGEAEIALGLER